MHAAASLKGWTSESLLQVLGMVAVAGRRGRLDHRGPWGPCCGEARVKSESNQKPQMACRLGRHLSEVSPPCLFTDVFECLPWARRYSRKQDTASPRAETGIPREPDRGVTVPSG